MTKAFSDAPLKIDGVKVKPKWPWSESYRREVRQSLNEAGAQVSDQERIEQYVEWYAKRHGLSKRKARRRLQRERRIA